MESVNLLPLHSLFASSNFLSRVEEVPFKLESLIHVLKILTEVDVVHALGLDAVNEAKVLFDFIGRDDLYKFELIEFLLYAVVVGVLIGQVIF